MNEIFYTLTISDRLFNGLCNSLVRKFNKPEGIGKTHEELLSLISSTYKTPEQLKDAIIYAKAVYNNATAIFERLSTSTKTLLLQARLQNLEYHHTRFTPPPGLESSALNFKYYRPSSTEQEKPGFYKSRTQHKAAKMQFLHELLQEISYGRDELTTEAIELEKFASTQLATIKEPIETLLQLIEQPAKLLQAQLEAAAQPTKAQADSQSDKLFVNGREYIVSKEVLRNKDSVLYQAIYNLLKRIQELSVMLMANPSNNKAIASSQKLESIYELYVQEFVDANNERNALLVCPITCAIEGMGFYFIKPEQNINQY
ncbi:MAG: hypothetical protein AB7F64_04745 [Gammaproteobacteria bacterium]